MPTFGSPEPRLGPQAEFVAYGTARSALRSLSDTQKCAAAAQRHTPTSPVPSAAESAGRRTTLGPSRSTPTAPSRSSGDHRTHDPPRSPQPAATQLQVPRRGTCRASRSGVPVKSKVTPLGSARNRPIEKVAAIVTHLTVPQTDPAHPTPEPAADGPASATSAYYADVGDGPGRWLGAQAACSGLSGTVQARDFSRVLGRSGDAHRGTADLRTGLSRRRSDLGSGNETRRDDAGRPLYGTHDAATVLGVSVRRSPG